MGTVEANRLSLIGIGFALVGLPCWVISFFSSYGYSSASTDLDIALGGYMGTLSLLSIFVTFFLFMTPLAALGQLPGLVYFQLYWWYFGYYNLDSYGRGAYGSLLPFYVLAVTGFVICIASAFLEIHLRHSSGVKTVRFRFRPWTFARREKDKQLEPRSGTTSLTRKQIHRLKLSILIAAVATSVTVTAFALDTMLTTNVSTLEVIVYVNTDVYGSVDLAIYVDGARIPQTHLEVYSWFSTWGMERGISAGSHSLGIDLANATTGGLDGVMELTKNVRVLPFTTEVATVTFQVGMM